MRPHTRGTKKKNNLREKGPGYEGTEPLRKAVISKILTKEGSKMEGISIVRNR